MAAPKIVCLCGSSRFEREFDHANLVFTLMGFVVLSIGCNLRNSRHLRSAMNLALAKKMTIEDIKQNLDDLHKNKIEMADLVFVVNVDGYIGESTKSEIEFARSRNKPIQYLFPSLAGRSASEPINSEG